MEGSGRLLLECATDAPVSDEQGPTKQREHGQTRQTAGGHALNYIELGVQLTPCQMDGVTNLTCH